MHGTLGAFLIAFSFRRGPGHELQLPLNHPHHVAQLPSWSAKVQWAEAQRQYGNQLYSAHAPDYEAAMDVYLTCLTVARHDAVMLGKVMNNVAQCTLQLGWYKKTETVCTLALQELLGLWSPSSSSLSASESSEFKTKNQHPQQQQQQQPPQQQQQQQQPLPDLSQSLSKLYFKRGKARRLRGDYPNAKHDLEQSLHYLSLLDPGETRSTESKATTTPPAAAAAEQPQQQLPGSQQKMMTMIQRELQLVARSAAEGKRNQERAQRAMQQILSPAAVAATDTSPMSPLYCDLAEPSRRPYSTLRVSCPSDELEEDEQDGETVPTTWTQRSLILLSQYWHWYVAVAGRVAEKLLEWMGDHDDDDDDENHHHTAKKKKNNTKEQLSLKMKEEAARHSAREAELLRRRRRQQRPTTTSGRKVE